MPDAEDSKTDDRRGKGNEDDASTSALNAGQRTRNQPRQYERTH
jgi:hypothetical protein